MKLLRMIEVKAVFGYRSNSSIYSLINERLSQGRYQFKRGLLVGPTTKSRLFVRPVLQEKATMNCVNWFSNCIQSESMRWTC
jgi:hypothetical protein